MKKHLRRKEVGSEEEALRQTIVPNESDEAILLVGGVVRVLAPTHVLVQEVGEPLNKFLAANFCKWRTFKYLMIS